MARLSKSSTKPKLQDLDEIFGLSGEETEGRANNANVKNKVVYIEIKKLKPFNNHLFSLYEGERLDDMVSSIKINGVLVPIIARKVDEILEILSGHNRVNAAKIAGLTVVPTIILESISDDEAMVYIVETNLIQRSFSDMAHSEKAAVIALHHSKMFSQGKRNDILEQIKNLEKPHNDNENDTFSQVGEKLNSGKKVAEIYGLSAQSVSRYLRIDKLIDELKKRLDNGDFAFLTGVTLSFLKTEEQKTLDDILHNNDFTIDMKKAEILRKFSEDSGLNNGKILQILSGEVKIKAKSTPTTVKLSKNLYSKYFTENQTQKEVQEVIEKALELYFSEIE